MLRRSPFHARVAAANETSLWSHWSGHLVVEKYQTSEKFEYVAIRNAVAMFDSSPLYKYRIVGPDAERFLGGVLARDVRGCTPGQARYTIWCDGDGFVNEDGVVFRHGPDDFLLTSAEPNLSYFRNLIGHDRVEISEVTHEVATLAVQGPNSRAALMGLVPDVGRLAYFDHMAAEVGGVPVTISRTGFTGDLGFEIFVAAGDAEQLWDAVADAGRPFGILPVGQTAVLIARIEAGLLLLGVDFEPSRLAENDAHRSTPDELGLGWMLKDLDGGRAFIGRDAIRRERRDGTSRWKMVGLRVDPCDYDRTYTAAAMVPPKDHTPVHGDLMVDDETGARVGYATSFVYSPILQRHIALARVRPEFAQPGTPVDLEFVVNHDYVKVAAAVARTPFFDPPRKTSVPDRREHPGATR